MKRIVVTVLWLYSFWYLGSFVSFLAGVPDILGPILGLSAGAFVGRDPRHLFWGRSTRQSSPATGVPAAA